MLQESSPAVHRATSPHSPQLPWHEGGAPGIQRRGIHHLHNKQAPSLFSPAPVSSCGSWCNSSAAFPSSLPKYCYNKCSAQLLIPEDPVDSFTLPFLSCSPPVQTFHAPFRSLLNLELVFRELQTAAQGFSPPLLPEAVS